MSKLELIREKQKETEILKWVLERLSYHSERVHELIKSQADPTVDGFTILRGLLGDINEKLEER